MDPETVVEAVQADAATEAANRVAGVAVEAAAVVAAEVADVGEVLEQHAELSEERHEEILEGDLWIRNQLEQLSQNLQTLQMTVITMQAAILAALTVQSTVTPQSTPPEPEIIAVVEPEESADVQPEAKTPPAKPQQRRRII